MNSQDEIGMDEETIDRVFRSSIYWSNARKEVLPLIWELEKKVQSLTGQASKKVYIKILDKRIGTEFPLPQYETTGSAAMDLRACLDEPLDLLPGSCVPLHTGISIYIEDANYAGIVLPRSGLGSREGIVLGNLTGLIDSDYQGEVMIPCWNRSETTTTINPGDRVAQLLVVPVKQFSWEVVDDFPQTDRGTSGFGSTGRQ